MLPPKVDPEVVELFKLGMDDKKWEEFCKKFRLVFAERLLERNIGPQEINYLYKGGMEAVENGDLLSFENKILQEEFSKLCQDARLLPDQIDELKKKFFTQQSLDSWKSSK
ncbi:MAG: hypothetical protein HY225_03295 [Candidatus Vogelbacteria bacterium]|nr:hypothetical protein [Candidatus Vogelbacteria bacterium]